MNYKYYLATTALSELWDIEADLILLGPWCLTKNSLKNLPEGKHYNIAESPWYPTIQRINALTYCEQLIEKIMHALSNKMNLIHNVDYPEKYWRILLGSWLSHFVFIYYDRYVRLKKALETCPEFYTSVLPKEKCNPVSYCVEDYLFGVNCKPRSEFHNYMIFSLLAHKICPNRTVEKDYIDETNINVIRKSWKRKLLNTTLFYIDRILGGKILLSEMYHVSLKDLLRLRIKLGINYANYFDLIYGDIHKEDFIKGHFSNELRERLCFDAASDEFQSILFQVISYAIPISYIERFWFYKKMINNMPHHKALVSVVGWYLNTCFMFYAAESGMKGTKLIEVQHGGNYGQALLGTGETLALNKDHFYTWGWKREENHKAIPLPSPYLTNIKNTAIGGINRIIFAGTTVHRYKQRLDLNLFPDDIEKYFGDKKKFLMALSDNILKGTLYRPRSEIGWNEVGKIRSIDTCIEIITKGKLTDWMKKAKTVVIDHPHTAFLEALTINVPSVFFWDHDIFLMRQEAEPYFQTLRDAGILYKDPVSAARKVNEIFDNPEVWWLSDKVQDVRKEFCSRFAYARRDWIDVWVKELRKFK
jgi:putative transferase (TIGR04331 family)